MASDIQDAIIHTVMDLLEDGIPVESVTIRDITSRLGISVSLVNYHFTSKDNLIKIVVQQVIDKAVATIPQLLDKVAEKSPREKLASLLNWLGDYWVGNAALARISILADLQDGHERDSTSQLFNFLLPLVREALDSSESVAQIKTNIIIYTLQCNFLRAERMKNRGGFDFYQKNQREKIINELLDTVLVV